MHTCIHAYMHTCIHAYMHTCIHEYVHTCIHEKNQARIGYTAIRHGILTYIHIHTCIHTYIHTYIQQARNGYTVIYELEEDVEDEYIYFQVRVCVCYALRSPNEAIEIQNMHACIHTRFAAASTILEYFRISTYTYTHVPTHAHSHAHSHSRTVRGCLHHTGGRQAAKSEHDQIGRDRKYCHATAVGGCQRSWCVSCVFVCVCVCVCVCVECMHMECVYL
jgi:hypothetical protein